VGAWLEGHGIVGTVRLRTASSQKRSVSSASLGELRVAKGAWSHGGGWHGGGQSARGWSPHIEGDANRAAAEIRRHEHDPQQLRELGAAAELPQVCNPARGACGCRPASKAVLEGCGGLGVVCLPEEVPHQSRLAGLQWSEVSMVWRCAMRAAVGGCRSGRRVAGSAWLVGCAFRRFGAIGRRDLACFAPTSRTCVSLEPPSQLARCASSAAAKISTVIARRFTKPLRLPARGGQGQDGAQAARTLDWHGRYRRRKSQSRSAVEEDATTGNKKTVSHHRRR